jgi:hypothetical protein
MQELLLCYTSKKVTSKLHKLTNYKSNYTSTMYMNVTTSLCKGDANQREDKDDTMIFLLRFTCLPTRYVPVVSTAHLVVRRLIGITCQARMSGTARTYPQVRVAQ